MTDVRSPRLVQGDVTLRRKKAFLDAFRRCGVVTYAAGRAGIARKTVYAWQEQDADFLAAFREAAVEAVEAAEHEAWRRGVQGVLKPVYQGGAKVGTVREFSDTLLIFVLKALKPEKYRDRVDVRQQVEATVTHQEAVRAHVQEADVERLTRALLGVDVADGAGAAAGREEASG
jgi:hypothetical protein